MIVSWRRETQKNMFSAPYGVQYGARGKFEEHDRCERVARGDSREQL